MFKLFVFAAVVAVASAGLINAPVAYTGLPAAASLASPLAYTGLPAAASLAYTGLPSLAYSGLAAPALAAAPITSYAAAPVAIPAPVTYTTGYKVINAVEPVEQHGYKIAY